MDRGFTITIRAPSGGWLPMTVRVGDATYEDVASWVLNDPLRELAVIAVDLRAGRALRNASVRLFGEPEGSWLRFVADADSTRVVVSLASDAFGNAVIDIEKRDVVAALIGAIDDVEAEHDEGAWDHDWHGFPRDVLKEVRGDRAITTHDDVALRAALARLLNAGDDTAVAQLLRRPAVRICDHAYPEAHRVCDVVVNERAYRVLRCTECGERFAFVAVSRAIARDGAPFALEGEKLRAWVRARKKEQRRRQ